MKRAVVVGIFSLLILISLVYSMVLFNPPASNEFFGLNVYQIAIQRDMIITLFPYFYILFLVVLVGGCLFFGKTKQVKNKLYWTTVSVVLPILLIYIGLLSGYLPYGPKLNKRSAVVTTLEQLSQNLEISEEDMIITGLSIRIQNVPRQRPIKIITSVRNFKTKQDITYQYPAKLSLSEWGVTPSLQHDIAPSRDIKIKDIKLKNLSEIIKETEDKQKSLPDYHSGICSIELDTRNLYWRVNVQNIFGEIAYTYIFSVDGEYIIRLSS